jgi:hypothetical protein
VTGLHGQHPIGLGVLLEAVINFVNRLAEVAETEAPPRLGKAMPPLGKYCARLLQAATLRSDVTVFRLNATDEAESRLKPAMRRNATVRIGSLEAAHDPEVAGSSPAPLLEKALATGPFAY